MGYRRKGTVPRSHGEEEKVRIRGLELREDSAKVVQWR